MVESSRAKINFIKLSSQELSSKIALLVSNHGRVVFWKTSPRYLEGVASSFEVRNQIYLTLEKTAVLIRLQNEKICLNFTLNNIDYFLRGKVVDHSDEDFKIKIELEEFCFRVEKRSRERLLTYPVYDVYAYLKFAKNSSNNNVISFNKGDQKAKDFFATLDSAQKNKIASIAPELGLDDEEDIIGFRVEDLSSNGLCFFASAKEKEMVLDKLDDSLFSLVLNFDIQVFNLDDAKIVYKINYINPQFAGVLMYKVGITFKHSPSLKRKIEDVSGITTDLLDYQKEFEEFIKNE